jgi:hypothetical protein
LQVVLDMPRGLGPNVELKVAIVSVTGTAESAPILYNYSTPSIVTVSPNPFDASGGQKLAIYGYNLGLVGLGPKPVVHLNGASAHALSCCHKRPCLPDVLRAFCL